MARADGLAELVGDKDTTIAQLTGDLEARVEGQTTEAAAQATTIATLAADRRHLEETLTKQREAHTAAMAGAIESSIRRMLGLKCTLFTISMQRWRSIRNPREW